MSPPTRPTHGPRPAGTRPAAAPHRIVVHDLRPELGSFRDAVLRGLARPRKAIEPKWFYDRRGSELFERITALPEYYPTRTEVGILRAAAREIALLLGPGCALVEYGSGSSAKIRVLLDAVRSMAAYVPIDISREFLLASCETLAADYPALPIVPVCADYSRPVDLPQARLAGARRRVVFFPGSTIGNMHPAEAVRFLRGAAGMVGRGGGMLIGVDRRKDPAVLEAAYDDAAGVTAAFNRNLLVRINRELGGTFAPDRFRHRALYDPRLGRVEMHLVSQGDQQVTVAGRRFRFADGESIHTESSYKYDVEGFRSLAREAGFVPVRVWSDAAERFSVHYLKT